MGQADTPFGTQRVRTEYDYLAPDGSEIRTLLDADGGNIVHCTLPPDTVSEAVMHTTVEEIWYVVSGTGRVWRKRGNTKSIDTIPPDTAFLIPPRVRFQFRAVGDDPFRAVIVTMPPWPGEHEAVHVENYWSTG